MKKTYIKSMEYYEARSLKEIKVLLRQKGYKSKSRVRDHISFLENLADKINTRIKDEIECGEVAWKEKEDLKKVIDNFHPRAYKRLKNEPLQ